LAVRVTLLITTASILVASSAEARSDDSRSCVPTPVVQQSDRLSLVPIERSMLTVASLNMAGEVRVGEILEAWKRAGSVGHADVLLLQEVRQGNGNAEAVTAALSRQLGLSFAYAPADLLENGDTQGLAILSRYPLKKARVIPLKYFRLRFRSRCRIALTATVETAAGSVRLVNVHLDTRINSRNRIAQLAPVIEDVKGFDGPQIIGGDFNTMNVFWFRTMWPFPRLQQQSKAVREALALHGFHTPLTATPSTFRFLGLPLRLDWLYLKNLEPLAWGVTRIRFSDHRGVWVQMNLKPRGPMLLGSASRFE
jgi:endonuclease/exonuclease/phosphatase family metal-dependent hydrolase